MNSQFALYVVGVSRAFVWLIGLALIWFQAFVGLLRVDVTPVLIAGLVAVLGLIVAITVAVHELGHVLAARMAHVRVDYCRIFCFEFCRDGGRMRFRIDTSRFPLLGMVRYEQSSDLTSLRQSAAVLAGGPAANFLAGLACLGFAALFNPPLTNEWPEHVRSGWRTVAFLHPGNCATAVLNVAAIFQFGCSLLNLLPSWLGPYWSDGASLLALWRTQKAWRASGYSREAFQFVITALGELCRNRSIEKPDETHHASAKELCDYLLTCRGEETPVILRRLGLHRSEDVGRVVFAMVNTGFAGQQESDTEGDFRGLFDLGADAT